MRLIAGEAQRSLCVWHEGVLRAPVEAERFLREGCVDEREPPTRSLLTFLAALSSGLGDAFPSAVFSRGRVVLRTADERSLRAAYELASCLGLSVYDRKQGVLVFLVRPRKIELLRCARLLARGHAETIMLDAPALTLQIRTATPRRLVLEVIPADVDAGGVLETLGFTRLRISKFERVMDVDSVSPMADVADQVLQSLTGLDSGVVGVHISGRRHLELVHAAPTLASKIGSRFART